jgi:hypothetical protein
MVKNVKEPNERNLSCGPKLKFSGPGTDFCIYPKGIMVF